MIEAAAEGAVQVAANEDQPEEKKEGDSKQESAAAGSGGVASEAAVLEIASLKKKLAEIQTNNERLELEAKTQEDENTQLNQEIYRLNEKLLIKEHGGGADQSN